MSTTDAEREPLLRNSAVDFQMQPLSRERQARLVLNYASFSITALYMVVLFLAVTRQFGRFYFGEINPEGTPPMAFQLPVSIFTGLSCFSDVLTQVFAVIPAEQAYAATEKPEEANPDNHLSPRVVRSRPFTYLMGYSAFFVGATSSMVALSSFTEIKPVVTGLGIVFTVLSVAFYHMLSGKDLRENHDFIFSAKCKEICKSIYSEIVASVEIFLQLLTNSAYRALNFAFFAASLLTFYSVKSIRANLILVGVSGIVSFYATIFTRFLSTKKEYIGLPEAEVHFAQAIPNRSGLITSLAINLIRAAGICYLPYTFIHSRVGLNAFVTFLLGAALFSQSVALSIKIGLDPSKSQAAAQADSEAAVADADSQKSLTASQSFFLISINFLSRLLRVFAVMDFLVTLQTFLNANDVAMNLNLLDTAMISTAALSVEANNFLYYTGKLRAGFWTYQEKHRREKKFSASTNSGFSCSRFFTRALEEYPAATDSALVLAGH